MRVMVVWLLQLWREVQRNSNAQFLWLIVVDGIVVSSGGSSDRSILLVRVKSNS
jgi:hypothetical protein